MTVDEVDFSLRVEEMLSKIQRPEFRQSIVEVRKVASPCQSPEQSQAPNVISDLPPAPFIPSGQNNKILQTLHIVYNPNSHKKVAVTNTLVIFL